MSGRQDDERNKLTCLSPNFHLKRIEFEQTISRAMHNPRGWFVCPDRRLRSYQIWK